MPYKDPALAKAAAIRSYHRRKGSEAYKEKLRRSAEARRERYKNDAAYKALVDARNALRRADPVRRRKAVPELLRKAAAYVERYRVPVIGSSGGH